MQLRREPAVQRGREPAVHSQARLDKRLNGALRDRLAALTRRTHAFAKTTRAWDALVGPALFEHHWLRPHPALRRPASAPGRRYDRRTPAMAVGLTEHRWSWLEFLTMPVPIRR